MLIQVLHAHNLSTPYDELRPFLTPAAKQETERAENGPAVGAYITPGLIFREEDLPVVSFMREIIILISMLKQ